jgi:hypothetical protein
MHGNRAILDLRITEVGISTFKCVLHSDRYDNCACHVYKLEGYFEFPSSSFKKQLHIVIMQHLHETSRDLIFI